MYWLDIVLAVFLVFALIRGLRRGLIMSLFPLAGIVGGVALAGRHYAQFAELIPLESPEWANIAAWAIIFVLVLGVAVALGHLFRRLLHLATLGWVDRLVGAIIGLGIGAVLCAAALTLVLKFYEPAAGVITQSEISRFLVDKFPLLLGLLPEEFDSVREFFQ